MLHPAAPEYASKEEVEHLSAKRDKLKAGKKVREGDFYEGPGFRGCQATQWDLENPQAALYELPQARTRAKILTKVDAAAAAHSPDGPSPPAPPPPHLGGGAGGGAMADDERPLHCTLNPSWTRVLWR